MIKNGKKTHKRKIADAVNLNRSKEREQESIHNLFSSSHELLDEIIPEDNFEVCHKSMDFEPVDHDEKYKFNSTTLDDADDDMPYCYRHIRDGERSVKPEYYLLC